MRLAFFTLYVLHFLPIKLLQKLAKGLGWLCYYLVVPRRKVGQINLAKCYPELTQSERDKILKAHFYHMACLILENGVFWYSKAERLQKLVHYVDKQHLDTALAQQHPVVILYPHFTAFEMASSKLNQDVPLISMYAHQKNQLLDERILKGRHRFNNAYLVARQDGFRGLIRMMRQRPEAPFVYLPDQDFGRKDSIFVNFFGIPTATITGLSRITQMTQAKVVPAIATRLDNGTYELRFYPAWEHFPSDDMVADTQRMNDFIEARVREHPEQYFWLHKRFKTRPEGEPKWY